MLNTWFSGKEDAHLICVFTLPGAHSEYFSTPEEATTYAVSISGKEVYFGVGMGATKPESTGRWSIKDIVAIPGLWADIDYQCPGSQNKKKIPTDRAAADAIIELLPWKPTMLVHSGHGLQAFWKFKEPWNLADPVEHAHAVELAAKWNTYIQRIAGTMGFTVDSVGDLARVMRVPGTTNHKGVPVPVVLEYKTENFIETDALDDLLSGVDTVIQKLAYHVDGIVINSEAHVPPDVIAAMIQNDPKFSDTWERKRKDMRDVSASGYDMAIANHGAMAGMDVQMIVNLIKDRREKWGDAPKNREDYLVRTAQKALLSHQSRLAAEKTESALLEVLVSGASVPEKRAKAMEHLSKVFNVEVTRIIRYKSNPQEYRLETEKGSVKLGGIAGLRSWQKFYDAVLDITGRQIPRFKTSEWSVVVDAFMAIIEDQEVGAESTDIGMISGWLDTYLESKTICANEKDSWDLHLPHRFNGSVRFFSCDFLRWVNLNHGKNFTPRAVGIMLRHLGCKPNNVTTKDGKSSRSMWEMP